MFLSPVKKDFSLHFHFHYYKADLLRSVVLINQTIPIALCAVSAMTETIGFTALWTIKFTYYYLMGEAYSYKVAMPYPVLALTVGPNDQGQKQLC